MAYFAKQMPEARVRWDINNLKAHYGTDVRTVIEEGKQRIAVVSKLFQDAVNKPQPSNPFEQARPLTPISDGRCGQ